MQLLAILGALVALVFNIYCFWRWFDFMARVERSLGDLSRRLVDLTETVEKSTTVIKKSIDGAD